jgi:hypothetical protein
METETEIDENELVPSSSYGSAVRTPTVQFARLAPATVYGHTRDLSIPSTPITFSGIHCECGTVTSLSGSLSFRLASYSSFPIPAPTPRALIPSPSLPRFPTSSTIRAIEPHYDIEHEWRSSFEYSDFEEIEDVDEGGKGVMVETVTEEERRLREKGHGTPWLSIRGVVHANPLRSCAVQADDLGL